jgi:tetratricopeptide (TPR) repeat protein
MTVWNATRFLTRVFLSSILLGVLWGWAFIAPTEASPVNCVVPSSDSATFSVNSIALPVEETPADQQVQFAQRVLQAAPNKPDGYNELAAAYLQKGRETGDFSYTSKAELALARSLHLESDNPTALKLRAVLLLNEHRFQEALELTQRLQQQFPQDAQIYTAMTDALVETGNYKEALNRIQTALDLHPGATVYARLSYLKSLHGDPEGAIAAMQQAIETAPRRDREGLAWYYVQLGNELLNAGRMAEAEQAIDQALQIFPQYHLALVAKAHTRLAAGVPEAAVACYHRALERMPLPDTAIALGDLYTVLGKPEAAERQYKLVEFLEQTGGAAFRKAYAQQLATFWADHNTHLEDALQLLQEEHETRSDIYTLDALAWCLFKLGRLPEARNAIAQAMRLGTHDPRIYYHAGMIHHHDGNLEIAKQYLHQALQINPTFDPIQAGIAKSILKEGIGG